MREGEGSSRSQPCADAQERSHDALDSNGWERVCPNCEGTQWFVSHGKRFSCEECRDGKVLTDAGDAVLAFLSRWLD